MSLSTSRAPKRRRFHDRKIEKRTKKFKVHLPLGGFPNRLMVRLKYVENIPLSPGVGGIAHQSFRANSLFDPNFTGIGHQPSNYDRLTAIYDRYTVVSSKINCFIYSGNNNVVLPGLLALHTSEDGTDLTTAHASGGIENVIEQPRTSRSIKHLGDMTTAGRNVLMSQTFSAKKFFGTKSIVGESPYSADIATNPSEGAFFEVAYMSIDDSNDPGAIGVRCEIEYIAVMTEPKISDAS